MQKLDKVAIIAAAVIILGGIIWSFLGADPGKQLSADIRDYADKIETTRGEQSSLPTLTPPDASDSVRTLFDVRSVAEFPEWSFYRRPVTFRATEVRIDVPPALSPGAICMVETVREAPSRVFQRVIGVRGSTNEAAEMTREILWVRATGGEWLEVAAVGAGDARELFEMEVETDLERGIEYQYRISSTAKSLSIPFANGSMTHTVESGESGSVLFPRDIEWECIQAQEGGLIGSNAQPGRATVVRYRWDWEKMRNKRDQAFAVEGDEKRLFDTDYTLVTVRSDSDPWKIILRGSQGRKTLLKGEKALPLSPPSWESEDPICTGEGEGDGEGDNAGTTDPSDTPDPTPTDADDGDAGGLFGGDD